VPARKARRLLGLPGITPPHPALPVIEPSDRAAALNVRRGSPLVSHLRIEAAICCRVRFATIRHLRPAVSMILEPQLNTGFVERLRDYIKE
jgi:hypothetical protein